MTTPEAMALSVLFRAFPSGVTDDTRTLYLTQLESKRADARDLAEMAQRILHVRESRTVPPLAELFKHLATAKADRERSEAARGPKQITDGLVRLGPHHVEEMRVWRALAKRGVHHCRVAGWITGGPCEHPAWECYGEGVSLAQAREQLAWSERENITMPKRQPAPKGFTSVGDAIEEIPF